MRCRSFATSPLRIWALGAGVSVGFLWAPSAHADDFVVDPEQGSISNTGAPDSPWSTLEEVLEGGKLGTTVQAGDRLLLRSGYHGDLLVDEGSFDPPVVIEADVGATPEVRRLRLSNVSGLVIRGLSISPSHGPSYETLTLVDVADSVSQVTIEGCSLFSEDDASSWSADDWIDRASNGAQIGGSDIVFRGNSVRNVRFGISADGERARIEGNTVDGFSADGLRGLGDHEVFEGNLVKNVYVDGDLDDNHDDGFQSWSVGPDGVGTGEVVGLVLRGNVILNYEDPDQPFRATLQGIGCFDGTFTDWVIENNVVITDHWHGITLLGAKNSRIVNNTVLDVNDESPGPPWISIDAHKDGTPPEGCLVRNNLATDYVIADTGVTEDHNFTIEDPFGLFVDPEHHDLHLLSDAEVIDQGSADQAPERDADGVPRPQGAGVDLGAFEWHEEDVGSEGGASSTGGAIGTQGGTGDVGTTGGRVSEGGATGAESGGTATSQGGSDQPSTGDGNDGGCGCRLVPGRTGATALIGLVAIGLLVGRRRSRRS